MLGVHLRIGFSIVVPFTFLGWEEPARSQSDRGSRPRDVQRDRASQSS